MEAIEALALVSGNVEQELLLPFPLLIYIGAIPFRPTTGGLERI